ncbi:MAG: glycine--tRNA ligase subunit beta, partial [Alphaproteobacteria bacterium]
RRAALGVIRMVCEARIRLPLSATLDIAARLHGFDQADGELLPFIRERLRVRLRDNGLMHDVVAAALGDDDGDDLLMLADRAAALGAFLDSENGAGLLAGWRRAASILKSEENRDKKNFVAKTDPALFTTEAERRLHETVAGLLTADNRDGKTPEALLQVMESLGALRVPIDGFFDDVVVNDEDPGIRENRLGLLAMVREMMLGVADFSKLEG